MLKPPLQSDQDIYEHPQTRLIGDAEGSATLTGVDDLLGVAALDAKERRKVPCIDRVRQHQASCQINQIASIVPSELDQRNVARCSAQRASMIF